MLCLKSQINNSYLLYKTNDMNVKFYVSYVSIWKLYFKTEL